MADEVLALLAPNGDEQVLDVGCGDGKVTAMIAARVPQGLVIGVDPSHAMIAFAAAHFGVTAHPNLRFEVADARALPFRDRFDLVVSFNALHWVPDQDAALRSIRAAMKTGARAQLRLVTNGECKSLESVVEDTRKSPRWCAHFRDFDDPYLRWTPEEYAAAAARSGLRTLRVHTELKRWQFDSRKAFFDFCSVGLIAWNGHLPEAERPVFVNEVVDRYLAIAADRPGAENTFKFYQTDITSASS
ncbi:MAG: methyltransferase domain-containing protein [Nitrococcus sp.]|nr:methyltransferase domain-containing protein [Nitrococcus sp.]